MLMPDEKRAAVPLRSASLSAQWDPEFAFLEMQGLSKRYGGVQALRGARLSIAAPGTAHALIGENGSGKSTLLGILSGQVRPDDGELRLGGRSLIFNTPADALREGIATVSQETAVAANLSVAENILMGRRLVRTRRLINWRASRAAAARILTQLKLDYDPEWLVGELGPGQRQMVEIARAISMQARILILDEPTSSLDSGEVAALFEVIEHLKREGVTILLVSHRLKELFQLCQTVTVLRDGQTVAQGALDQFDHDSLIAAMVGPQARTRTVARASRGSGAVGPTALEIRDLSAEGSLQNISLEVRAGEIIGLAGLIGSGRSELLECLFGLRAAEGAILVGGSAVDVRTPRDAIRAGIAFLPPDRKAQGLVLSGSARTNMMAVATAEHARAAMPRRRFEDPVITQFCRSMHVRLHDVDAPVSALSGGNQQKIALAKWLVKRPTVLLLDEPTRGVDVNAKREIHRLLEDVASEGVALLVSSSEPAELLELCDRILVMSRGRSVELVHAASANEETLMRLATGAGQSGHSVEAQELPTTNGNEGRPKHAPVGDRSPIPARTREGAMGARVWRAVHHLVPVLALLAVTSLVFTMTSPGFLTGSNLSILLTSNAQLWVVAMALTFVMVGGAIDLSVAAMMALLGVLFAKLLELNVGPGASFALTLAAGALLGGLANGFLIARLRLSFLLVTLATTATLTGLVNLWTGTIAIPVQTSLTEAIAFDSFAGVAISIWIMAAIFLIGLLVQVRTYFGRDIYAVGGNPVAAHLAGISTVRTTIAMFALTGMAAALAAVIGIGRTSAASPSVDSTVPFQAIAAVLLGGARISGGTGGVGGTALGVLFLATIENGLSLSGAASYWQKIVTGAILVGAVLIYRLSEGEEFGGLLRYVKGAYRKVASP